MTEPRPSSRDLPANGWCPETESRRTPKPVEVAANLLCINGGLGLLGGLFGMVAYSLSPLGLLITVADLLISAMLIRAGILVRQLGPWGRSAGIVLSVVTVLLTLPFLGRGVVTFAICFLLSGATIVLLYSRDALPAFPTAKGLLRL